MKYNRDFVEIKNDRKNETGNLAIYLFTHIFLYVLLIFFAIFFAWYTVFITTHSFYAVKGPSMMPTLNNQITIEQLHESSLNDLSEMCFDGVYLELKDPKIFDVVVIDTTPKIADDSIIKRVIAKEGDYVSIVQDEDGFYRVFRIAYGENLENFTDEQAKLLEEGENGYTASHLDWEDNVLAFEDGDFSYESEFYSTFLDGKEADFVSSSGMKYVQVPENKVFCLGDNRGYSSDSRSSSRGFFAESSIVGRCEFVVKNFNFANRIWEVVKFYFSEVEKFFAR